MINVEKQIEYWVSASSEDLITAKWLLEGNRLREALFFCHLALEKLLKAFVVKHTLDLPPRTHDLFLLVKKANLELNESDLDFLGIMMKYQIEGRYPQYLDVLPTIDTAGSYYQYTSKLVKWLTERL